MACVGRRLGIGAHFHPPEAVCPPHEGRKITRKLGLDHRYPAPHHLASRAIDRDHFTFAGDLPRNREHLLGIVDLECPCPRHTRPAHTSRHHRSVAGHPTARGENASRRMHAVNVFRTGLDAYQDDFVAFASEPFSFTRVEHDFSRRGAGRRRKASHQHEPLCFGVKRRVQKLIQ